MNTLKLKLAERKSGSRVKFLDFVVDGQSLYELLGRQFDTVSCLASWPNTEEFRKAMNRLLLREEADFLNNRRSLYICGECGGLDCGAVSLVIEEKENVIVWRSFGYENTYEDALHEVEGVTSFTFDKAQYTQTIEKSFLFFQQNATS